MKPIIRKGGYYKRAVVVLMMSFILSASWSLVVGAEMYKQGEGTLKTAQSETYKALRMEKERLEFQLGVTGFVVEAPENSPTCNATNYALEESHIIQAADEE